MAALQVGPSFVNQSVCEILGGWLEIFHTKKEAKKASFTNYQELLNPASRYLICSAFAA